MLHIRKMLSVRITSVRISRITLLLWTEVPTTPKWRQFYKMASYKLLWRDSTVRMENRIADSLKQLRNTGHIDDKVCDFLTPQYSTPHRCTACLKSTKKAAPCDLLCQPSTPHPTNCQRTPNTLGWMHCLHSQELHYLCREDARTTDYTARHHGELLMSRTSSNRSQLRQHSMWS